MQLQQASEITMFSDAAYKESPISIDVGGSNENGPIKLEPVDGSSVIVMQQ